MTMGGMLIWTMSFLYNSFPVYHQCRYIELTSEFNTFNLCSFLNGPKSLARLP